MATFESFYSRASGIFPNASLSYVPYTWTKAYDAMLTEVLASL